MEECMQLKRSATTRCGIRVGRSSGRQSFSMIFVAQAGSSGANAGAKLVKRKGLDRGLPPELRSKCHVFEIGDVVYEAMLNQTNIPNNSNKYYAMQVLESDDKADYYTFLAWGRIGCSCCNISHYNSQEPAIRDFERKFYEKTKNRWDQRGRFVPHPGKYTLLELEKEQGHKLIIGDVNLQVTESGEAERTPLGRLSRCTILKGYELLKHIAVELDSSSPNVESLEQLSSQFYTIVPHDFGYRSIRDQTIRTKEQLNVKLQMLEALGETNTGSKKEMLVQSDSDFTSAS